LHNLYKTEKILRLSFHHAHARIWDESRQ
jgi:hypothetical protein